MSGCVGPRPAQLCRQRNDHKPQDQQKVSLQRGRALNRNRQKYPSFKLSAVHPTNPTLKVIAQHQATSPRRPWHRIPSYEVKNLSGQIEQLAGQYYVLNWRSKKNASEFVWQWMEPGALTSRLWSDFRCSQLLSLFQLPNHQLQNYPRRLKTYDALVIRFALKFGSNCVT